MFPGEKGFEMVVTVPEFITPELASSYLLKNKCNRKLSSAHVNKLRKTIEAGKFEHTHQGIAFDTIGNLTDGQHRLTAIIESGIGVWMQVSRGIEIKSKSVIDLQSRPRSFSDQKTIDGWSSAKQRIAVTRLWGILAGRSGKVFADHEIEEFHNQHKEAIDFALFVADGRKTLKHAAFLTMMAIGYEAGFKDEITSWADVIQHGVTTEPWQCSATRLRDWWMVTNITGGDVSSRVECCHRIYSSMIAWVQKKPLAKLYARQTIEWIKS